MFPHTVYSQVNQRPWTTRRCLSISVWCLLVSLLFRLAGFLCQWEVRLKKCNNAFSEPLLRDRAERSLAMPPPTGRQMALAHNKNFFFKKSFIYYLRPEMMHCISSLVQMNKTSMEERSGKGEALKASSLPRSRSLTAEDHVIYTRQLGKLKIVWFKLVKTTGHAEGLGLFNGHNQWSSFMIKNLIKLY